MLKAFTKIYQQRVRAPQWSVYTAADCCLLKGRTTSVRCAGLWGGESQAHLTSLSTHHNVMATYECSAAMDNASKGFANVFTHSLRRLWLKAQHGKGTAPP